MSGRITLTLRCPACRVEAVVFTAIGLPPDDLDINRATPRELALFADERSACTRCRTRYRLAVSADAQLVLDPPGQALPAPRVDMTITDADIEALLRCKDPNDVPPTITAAELADDDRRLAEAEAIDDPPLADRDTGVAPLLADLAAAGRTGQVAPGFRQWALRAYVTVDAMGDRILALETALRGTRPQARSLAGFLRDVAVIYAYHVPRDHYRIDRLEAEAEAIEAALGAKPAYTTSLLAAEVNDPDAATPTRTRLRQEIVDLSVDIARARARGETTEVALELMDRLVAQLDATEQTETADRIKERAARAQAVLRVPSPGALEYAIDILAGKADNAGTPTEARDA